MAAGVGNVTRRLFDKVGARGAEENARRAIAVHDQLEDYVDYELPGKLDKRHQMHKDRLLMWANASARLACASWRVGSLETYDQLMEHREAMTLLGDRTQASLYLPPEDRAFLAVHTPDLAGRQQVT